MPGTPWVDDGNAALFTDLYQLTMVRAYLEEGRTAEATFDLFVRDLPADRGYLVAAGLEDALRYLEELRLTRHARDYLERLPGFTEDFLDRLESLRFLGEVRAIPEGTPVFAGEPILSVTASLPEAQLVESFLLNQVTFQTNAASKAARVVRAAAGRHVVDFGLRRMQGTDAAMKAARAFWIAGVAATSNVLAGDVYDLPVTGTMAHSYVLAHGSDAAAFRAFTGVWPETVLLVDTWDTVEGVREVVRLAEELGDDFRVRAIRLDSGDLGALARRSREILDDAGLQRVEIFASGGLDEHSVAALVEAGAPIDGFGVGTRMGVCADAPALDTAYKLVAYDGRPCRKLSPGKETLPGRKQVYRQEEGGRAVRDVVALCGEEVSGRPLLEVVMREGRRTPAGHGDMGAARDRAREGIAALPPRILGVRAEGPPYEVALSPGLRAAIGE